MVLPSKVITKQNFLYCFTTFEFTVYAACNLYTE
uniref:Uncharacterized protein n=1 Tax=Anguilla anguilla TaxID=7936 RepID=A0A0E9PCR4_ANGAN